MGAVSQGRRSANGTLQTLMQVLSMSGLRGEADIPDPRCGVS